MTAKDRATGEVEVDAVLERLVEGVSVNGHHAATNGHAAVVRVRDGMRDGADAGIRTALAFRDWSLPSVLTWALVVVGMAAAGFLRFWHLGALGYNSDEAVYSGQAASIANDPDLKAYFPIFRAHPLLYQSFLSIGYHLGIGELFGRLASAGVGLLTIVVVYKLGVLLWSRNAGAWAAFFFALMPYHILVTRQVLLDGPMTLFATLTLYFVARWALRGNSGWLYAAGGAMGLTFLAKETGILLVAAIYAFVALSPELRFRLRNGAISLALMVLVILPFPVSVMLAGRGDTGRSFLVWQLFRRPNHTWTFYLEEVPRAIGPAVVVLAVLGLWLLRRDSSWRERLLICWIVVPTAFFELWPVKGFQYLLPVAPAVALLAGRAVDRLPSVLRWDRGRAGLAVRAAALIALVSIALPTWTAITSTSASTFLAGTGGVPGGREVGTWLDENIPQGSVLLAIGPSMANIAQFYGHRKAYGLSVSPNPLHRNPSYDPVPNPDLLIRQNELQYLVWDSFSAGRTPFFSQRLLRYADRYHGRVVHTETIPAVTSEGKRIQKPIIVVYEVRP